MLADYKGDDIYGPDDTSLAETARKQSGGILSFFFKNKIQKTVRDNLAEVSFGCAKKPKGIGFLIDSEGNDRYYANENGRGESCGGVIPPQLPQNWSCAYLIDSGGDDFYLTKGRRNNHFFRYLDQAISLSAASVRSI